MPAIRIQGEKEREMGIFYEYDPSDIPLGEGGMGKVFRGRCFNEKSGQHREVAIKFLYSDLPSHVITRARREVSVQLRNDRLVEMLGFVEVKSKDELRYPVIRYHVISEFLHGVSLHNLLKGQITDYKGEVIPFAQELYGNYLSDPYHFALTIVRNILTGLIALHDAGYIHRDIDPSNIMITADSHIKLIDFGIAKKITGNNTAESSYTIDGQFIGKPKYAAPELVRGLVDSQGVSTDIYSIGIILFQLVTGHVPFEGEMAEVLEMQLNKTIPLNEIKQKSLRNVVKIATQKKRTLRFQSAAEFRVVVDKLMPLPYPEKGINLKTVGISIATVILCVIIGISVPKKKPYNHRQHHVCEIFTTENGIAQELESESPCDSEHYVNALTLLRDKSTARQGFDLLKSLTASDSESVKYNATFLLSRLYFKSGQEADKVDVPDSILSMQGFLTGVIEIDNAKAHQLLEDAITINSSDYHSLYELGCDYKSKGKRGVNSNREMAKKYLDKAYSLAKEAGDKEFQEKIRERASNL